MTQSTADLEAVLTRLRTRIATYLRQSIGEQDTKAALIVPVLRALGWDVEDLEDVKLEYRRRPNDNPVDYALFLLRTPRLFIEAKSLGSHIDDGKWASQILNYATMAGVEWVALTDGNEWRVYNSHATVPVEQKLFRKIRIAEPGSRPAETLGLLSKAQLQEHLIDQYWKTEVVDRRVGDVLRALFAPEPDPAMVRMVHARAPTLARSEVHSSLARLRPTFDFPVVVVPPVSTHVPGARPAASAPTPAGAVNASQPPSTKGEGTPWRGVTLGQLIEAGLVRLPLGISIHYRGTDLVARIEGADRVVLGDVAYDSLSTAAGMARLSVVGPTAGRSYPQTNGWTFWRYRAEDGSLHFLDELRRELFERRVVSIDHGRRIG